MVALLVPPLLFVALVAVALLAGVGITTIGPGGIFVTIALYVLTPLSSAEVAGTAHATFVATGLVGTAAYARSGELLDGDGRSIAAILSATSVIGALAGAHINTYVSRRLFGVLLGTVAALTGVILLYRETRGLDPAFSIGATSRTDRAVLGSLGVGLGLAGGLVGVGGPVLAVPALVMLGVPILSSLAVAQVQSIFISAFATAGYLTHGAVSLPHVLLVGIPQLIGVLVGWKVAHVVDPARLKVALGAVLAVVGAYLVASS